MNILQIVKALRATTSRNEKKQILEDNKENPTLPVVLSAVSSPFSTFYLKKMPDSPKFDSEEEENSFNQSVQDAKEFISISGEDGFDQTFGGIIDSIFSKKDIERNTIRNTICFLDAMTKNYPEWNALLANIVEKDLSAGTSISTINAVFPSLIKEFKFMKAEEKAHLPSIKYPAQADLKLDGQAAFVIVSPSGDVVIRSSSGREYEKLPTIKADVKKLVAGQLSHMHDGFVLCAELIKHDEDGNRVVRQISNGFANKARSGSIKDEDEALMRLYVYDVLSSATQLERGIEGKPLRDRMTNMPFASFLHSSIIPCPSWVVDSKEKLDALFIQVKTDGEEGLIAKNRDSIYEAVRSTDWIKMKAEIQAEAIITDVIPHKKKPDQVGSLLIESSDGMIKGKIGTKLSEKTRIDLMKMHLDGKLVGKIITAEFHEITYSNTKKVHSFYLPRFIEIRDDKNEADSFDKIMSM